MKHKVTSGNIVGVKMGNMVTSLCSSNNNNKRGGQPPRDLAGLVEELVLAEAGQEPGWGTQFRSFLKQRDALTSGQASLEDALDFVTLASRLSTLQDQARNTDNKTKQEELRLKRISLLQQMGEKYFKTESDKCLALANQELHAELRAKLAAVTEKSTEAELEEAARLVLLARQDSRVWRAGLDTSYKTFLANKPSSNVKAVLLSIL